MEAAFPGELVVVCILSQVRPLKKKQGALKAGFMRSDGEPARFHQLFSSPTLSCVKLMRSGFRLQCSRGSE
jgi:hypothetical protein